MKRGKFEHPRPVKPARKGLGVKVAGLALAGLLVFGCGVGGTLAWLLDKSETVTNTFTSSDINITLTEATGDKYQMIPGHTIAKDPKVTVEAGSEDCWLFVKVDENLGSWTNLTIPTGENDDQGNPMTRPAVFTDYLHYRILTGWTAGTGECTCDLTDGGTCSVESHGVPVGVYFKKIDATATSDTVHPILVDNKVTVDETVTKKMMEMIDGKDTEGNDTLSEVEPTLTFTAYATQYFKTNGTPFTAAEAWELAKGLDPANP